MYLAHGKQPAYTVHAAKSHDMLQLPTFASPQTFSPFYRFYESNIRFINLLIDSLYRCKKYTLKNGGYNILSL